MNPQHTRNMLLRRHAELSRRLLAVEADLQKSHSRDWSEQAQERENDEVLEGLAAQTFRELVQVRRVLKKIGGEEYSHSDYAHTDADMSESTYGTCRHCGRPIGQARLKALPEAEHCIQCAHELEEVAVH